jgi:hypothetical protein
MTSSLSSLALDTTNPTNVLLNYCCSEDSKSSFEVANTMKSTPSCSNYTKKSVCFNPVVYGRSVLHINDYSDDELRSQWYTDLEYQDFKAEIRTTVLLMMRGSSLILGNGEQYCAHGLESATRDGSRKKRRNKLHARSAVIDEQELQNARGHQECDDQMLARIYFDCTRHCQYEAHDKALALGALLDETRFVAAQVLHDHASSYGSVKTADLSPESRRRGEYGLRLQRQSSATRTMISTAAA